tara:strand:- start:417 stop:3242 length:2826 start_codon:yes stop_codon:yes gene_type:complete
MIHFNRTLFIVLSFIINLTNHAQSLIELGFGNDNTFDVITWNLENFPKVDGTTENYVSDIIIDLESEIIGFQEISDITAFEDMINFTPGYIGYILDANYGGINLAFAVKNDVTVIDDYGILSSSNYNYAFAGRPPYLIHIEKNNIEYYVINVHLKCCGDGNLNTSESSDEENRRLVALNHIKTYIDNNLSNENVLVIGDFNDELDDNTDDNVFQNFIDDSDNYLFTDMSIATGNPQNFSFPNWSSHIDHILITNELFDEFNFNESQITCIQIDDNFIGGFNNYDSLITDHLPVGLNLIYTNPCEDSLLLNNDDNCTSNNDYENIYLFFSEYSEGSSHNKYLEIYNPTSNTVSLENYALALVVNDPTEIGVYDSWHYFDINSYIPAFSVYTIAHPLSDSLILNFADMTTTHLSNGDDGIALVYGNEPQSNLNPEDGQYLVLDRIGDWNGDPGSGWSVAGVTNATKNHTLIRKCHISNGNPEWFSSSGTNNTDSEWIVLSINDWSDLGQHNYPCEIIINGCTDPSAGNYNPEANFDDGSCHSPLFACDIVPNGLFVDNIIHNRVRFNWSNPSSYPSYYMIRYRPVGANSWTVMTAGPVNNNEFSGTSRTRYFMEPSTNYEWNIRARVLNEDGSTNCQSSWSATSEYTTLPSCPNLDNLTVNTEANWVTFSADAPSDEWGVWQSKAKIKEIGTNSLRYANGDDNGNINELKGNFSASTSYEWHTKAWCIGNVDELGNSDPQYHSGWGEFSEFTTEDICDKIPINLSTSSNGANTTITMNWELPLSGTPDHYFLELNDDITGQQWQWNNITGDQTSQTKFNLSSSDYSWRIRGACGSNGTSWATIFTQPEYYTLGGNRLEGDIINDLEIYPNPSKDIFNISIKLKSKEDFTIKIYDKLGQIIFCDSKPKKQFHNYQINLNNFSNGIYSIVVETNSISLNKKFILH